MCPNKSKVTVAGLMSCVTRSTMAFPKFCNSRQSDSRVSWLAMSRILSWADWNNKPKKHKSTSSKHLKALPHLHAFALLCCFINLDNTVACFLNVYLHQNVFDLTCKSSVRSKHQGLCLLSTLGKAAASPHS